MVQCLLCGKWIRGDKREIYTIRITNPSQGGHMHYYMCQEDAAKVEQFISDSCQENKDGKT